MRQVLTALLTQQPKVAHSLLVNILLARQSSGVAIVSDEEIKMALAHRAEWDPRGELRLVQVPDEE